MKKILIITLSCFIIGLLLVIMTPTAFAATTQPSILLKNPFLRIWNAIHNLQNQLNNINLTPGPEGPQGPQGPQGEPGVCSCTETDLALIPEFKSLQERVEALENALINNNFNNNKDCIWNSDCDDNDPCTEDFCDANLGCTYFNINNDSCLASSVIDSSENTNSDNKNSSQINIVITEIMYNPEAVSDTYGEWFEIYNSGSSEVNLRGWSVTDSGTDSFVINEELVILPWESVVLCRNGDYSLNGGVICDYKYSGFTLSNTVDSIILKNTEGFLIDKVVYDTTIQPWKILNKPGYTIQLASSSYDAEENDDGANWCNAFESYGLGDKGTPGTINSECKTV